MDSFLQVGTPHGNHALVLNSESRTTLMQKVAPCQSQPSTPDQYICLCWTLLFFSFFFLDQPHEIESKKKKNNSQKLLVGLQNIDRCCALL
jgi:hypothetical protein